MGKQSARMIYQGKDHKDVYFGGEYHEAMYKGNQLVWKKLYDKGFILPLGDSFNDEVKVFNPEDKSLCSAVIQGYRNGNTDAMYGQGKIVAFTEESVPYDVKISNNGIMWKPVRLLGIRGYYYPMDSCVIATSPIISGSTNVYYIKLNSAKDYDFVSQEVYKTKFPVNGFPQFLYSPLTPHATIKPSLDKFIAFVQRGKYLYDVIIVDKNANTYVSEINTEESYDTGFIAAEFPNAAVINNDIAYFVISKHKYDNSLSGYASYLVVYESYDYINWNKRVVSSIKFPIHLGNPQIVTPAFRNGKLFYFPGVTVIKDAKIYITEDFKTFQEIENRTLNIGVFKSDRRCEISLFDYLYSYREKINKRIFYDGNKMTLDTDDIALVVNVRANDGNFIENGILYIDNLVNPNEEKCFIIDTDTYLNDFNQIQEA